MTALTVFVFRERGVNPVTAVDATVTSRPVFSWQHVKTGWYTTDTPQNVAVTVTVSHPNYPVQQKGVLVGKEPATLTFILHGQITPPDGNGEETKPASDCGMILFGLAYAALLGWSMVQSYPGLLKGSYAD